jgi:hypothetical protein
MYFVVCVLSLSSTLCCLFLWIIYYWVSLPFSLTFIPYRLMYALFHIRTVISRDRYRTEGFNPRVDIGRGMITVLKWKKACINLFITYLNIELKRTKLTSHTDTKHIWIWVINIGWGIITALLWKKAFIVLFIKRFDIMLFYL